MTFPSDVDDLITYLSDSPTNEQLKEIASLLPRLRVDGGNSESYAFILSYLQGLNSGNSGGDASSANQLLQLTELESINDKIPALVGGKIPVDIASLNVTVDNANLEISNDVGNPVPVSDGGNSLTVDGTVIVKADTLINQTNALKVDGSTVIQPVSASSLPLPTGASTETTLSTLNVKIPSNLTVSNNKLQVDNGLLQPLTDTQLRASPVSVSGTITANAGTNLNTSALALESGGNLASINTKLPSNLTVSSTRLLVDGSGVTQGVQGTRANSGSDTTSGKTHLTVGGSDGTNLRVLSTDNTGKLNVVSSPNTSSTGTFTSVAASATDVTLLASNANRKGCIIYNDSTAILYILLANSTSSATAFTQKLYQDEAYTLDFNYTGIIKGIWASATGNARITEFS